MTTFRLCAARDLESRIEQLRSELADIHAEIALATQTLWAVREAEGDDEDAATYWPREDRA